MTGPRYKTVLFDLDGTILETDAGVLGGIRHALDTLGLPWPKGVAPRRFLGPPLGYSFGVLCGLPDEAIPQAVRLHREYYAAKGCYEARPYPGIPELMADLARDGAAVCIATAKYRVMADKVIDHFNIRPCLTYAAMSGGGERASAKSEIISEALAHCGVKPADAVMIGDTAYDAEGARKTGTPFIGVLYGYGTREEMAAEGATVFAANATELRCAVYNAA